MARPKPYIVVEFDDGMQLIASNWLKRDTMEAYWPNFTTMNRYYKAVKGVEPFQEWWTLYSVKRIFAEAETYEKGLQNLKDAEVYSDFNSDANDGVKKSQRRKRAHVIYPESELSDNANDTESQLPPPPLPVLQPPPKSPQSKVHKPVKKRLKSMESSTVVSSNVGSKSTKNRKLDVSDEVTHRHKQSNIYPDPKSDKHPDSESDKYPDFEIDKHPDSESDKHPDPESDNYPDPENAKRPDLDFHESNIDDNTRSAVPLSPVTLNPKQPRGYAYGKENDARRSQKSTADTVIPLSGSLLSSRTDTHHQKKSSTPNEPYISLDDADLKTYQKYVVRSLIHINNRLKSVFETLDVMNEKLQNMAFNDNAADRNQRSIEAEVSLMDRFPLRRLTELRALERELSQDSFRRVLTTALLKIGGSDYKANTVRLMERLFSNYVGAKFSWLGLKGKRVFSKLNLCSVILDVVGKVNSTELVTQDMIAKVIKDWLRHAKERLLRERPPLLINATAQQNPDARAEATHPEVVGHNETIETEEG